MAKYAAVFFRHSPLRNIWISVADLKDHSDKKLRYNDLREGDRNEFIYPNFDGVMIKSEVIREDLLPKEVASFPKNEWISLPGKFEGEKIREEAVNHANNLLGNILFKKRDQLSVFSRFVNDYFVSLDVEGEDFEVHFCLKPNSVMNRSNFIRLSDLISKSEYEIKESMEEWIQYKDPYNFFRPF